MLDKHYQEMAKGMVEAGATRGMVIQKLRREGIDDETIERAFDKAQSIIVARKRAQGLIQMILGALIIVTAGVVMFSIKIMERWPVMMAIGGALVFFYGVNNMLHQSSSAGKKSR